MKNLKSLVVTLAVVFMISGQFARAEEKLVYSVAETERSYNVSVNPLGMLWGLFNLGVDFKVSKRSTLGVEGAFSAIGSSGGSLAAFGAGIRYSYYLTGEALTDGWYLSPFVYALPIVLSDSYSSTTVPLFAGAVAGYHWVYKNGFNMMFGAGAQYATIANSGGYAVLPALEYRLGFTF